MTAQERIADAATGISLTGWLASIATQTLPIVQWIAGVLAIISACFAIRYYWHRTK